MTNWYKNLSERMNPTFTNSQFERYLKRHKERLSFFKKNLGVKIIDLGCGFGYSGISLGKLGFDVIGIDENQDVINSFNSNAKKFNSKAKGIVGNIFNLKKLFKHESFDSCYSGGLLEHFSEIEINKLINIQFYLANKIMFEVPIYSEDNEIRFQYKDKKKHICNDGVFRNMWTEYYWINSILKDYNIIHSSTSFSSKDTGGFLKLTIVLKK